MAEPQPFDGSSTSNVCVGSESSLQLNIKTLDSRIYSFDVEKNIAVSAFKERVAAQSGVPAGQQRLIFRGKVLKDDHLLSEYNVENGDTLHLVERQPQPTSGSSTAEANSSNASSRGQDSNTGGSRHRIGSIAHSIVLGTLNVGDPGEAVVPDLNRVIGAVLNTIGIGNQAGGLQPGFPASHGNEADGSHANAVGQNQGGNESVPWQIFNGPSASNSTQIPLGAPIPVPSLNMPIPDSLSTLTEFMNRMELALSRNGDQTNQPTASGSEPATVSASNSHGFPTIECLSTVLQHAQNLLSDHVVPAISHTAVHLNQEGQSNDPAVRGQVQTESNQLGMVMQHLGALFLELGRTVLTLRMGQTPADFLVNAGPAVYISPAGPNPIMVQPFPMQTSSIFGGSSGVAMNPITIGPVGVANVPRNVNIHIHTGAALAPAVARRVQNGENTQGEHVNATESAGSGQAHGSIGLDIAGAAVQSAPITISVSGGVPSGSVVAQAPDSHSPSPTVAEINSRIRSLVANMQSGNHAASGQSDGSTNQEGRSGLSASIEDTSRHGNRTGETSDMDDQKVQNARRQLESEPSVSFGGDSHRRLTTSGQGNDNPGGSSDIPIGLGVGGLQPKRRGKQPRAQSTESGGPSASSQNQQSLAVGQHVLQSLASLSTRGSSPPSAPSPDVARGIVPRARQNADGQGDIADAMSEMLQGPALDGLLAGVSQQTGMGSPDMLRNMLQQFTQNPAMRNTVSQIAQQIDNHDLGGMFSGMDQGPGGGIDLSRMMQQMMPIVSRALGGVSSVSELGAPSRPVLSESRSRSEMMGFNDDPQGDLRQVVQRLINRGSPQEIFTSLADRAVNLYSDGGASENVINEVCNQEGLAQEFMQMLYRDISQRFHDIES